MLAAVILVGLASYVPTVLWRVPELLEELRRFKGKLQWEGDLSAMRTDK